MEKIKKPRNRIDSNKNDMLNAYYERNLSIFEDFKNQVENKIKLLKVGRRRLDHNMPLYSKLTKGELSSLVFCNKSETTLSIATKYNFRMTRMKFIVRILNFLKMDGLVIPTDILYQGDNDHVFKNLLKGKRKNGIIFLSEVHKEIPELLDNMSKRDRCNFFKESLCGYGNGNWFRHSMVKTDFANTSLESTLFYLNRLGYKYLLIDYQGLCIKFSKMGLYE